MRFLLFIFFLSLNTFAQIGGEGEVYLKSDRIEPKFNGGGVDKFYEYINQNFDFSKVTKSGRMITAFTISEFGDIKNIKVIQFVDVESATEIIRVLRKTPKWSPATQNGKPISVEIKFPLDFKFSEEDKIKEQVSNQTDRLLNEIQSDSVDNKKSGGLKNFYKFIRNNYNNPDIPNLKGKVVVRFTINEDGTLTDFKIIKDLNFGAGEELIRVLKLTSGKWTPAMKNGKKVKSTFTLPIDINTSKE